MWRRTRSGLASFVLSAGMALAALAFAPAAVAAPLVSLPGAVEPGQDRPLPHPAPTPAFDFSVEAPHRSAVPRAVDEIKFKLTDIKIDGATTLSAAYFRPLYANMIGKQISLADIFNIADEIDKEY